MSLNLAAALILVAYLTGCLIGGAWVYLAVCRPLRRALNRTARRALDSEIRAKTAEGTLKGLDALTQAVADEMNVEGAKVYSLKRRSG